MFNSNRTTDQKVSVQIRMPALPYLMLKEMSELFDFSMTVIICQAIEEKYDRIPEQRKQDLLNIRNRKLSLAARRAQLKEELQKIDTELEE